MRIHTTTRKLYLDSCVIPNCKKAHSARGLCSMHWRKWDRAGRPIQYEGATINGEREIVFKPECLVEGCGTISRTRSLCGKHYKAWKTAGGPEVFLGIIPKIIRRFKVHREFGKRVCQVPSCDNWLSARGLCSVHYNKWLCSGKPGIFMGSEITPTKRIFLGWQLDLQTATCKVCNLEQAIKEFATKSNQPPYTCLYCWRSKIRSHGETRKIKAIDLMGGECSKCGLRSEYPCVFDFHHPDPSAKRGSIERFSSWDGYWEEASQCVLLCSNCHRIIHWEDTRLREPLFKWE